METVATNRPDYAPGSIVHVTGTGYAPACDVVVKITRPDGLVVIGDGSDAPGSDTVTTDPFGNLAYDYQLDGFPAVEGTYAIDVLGLGDNVLANMTFTDANNDSNVAPEWAPGNTATMFNTLYRVTAGGTVQHVRITLPAGYTNISTGATAFSAGTWGTPVVNQTNRTIDVSLSSGTGIAVGGWARIDVIATTPASQNGPAARWLLETFTNTAGTAGGQNDQPAVLVNDTTNPSASVSFVDGSGNTLTNPIFQNGVAAIVRVRITQSGSGIKYVDVAIPTCFSSPTGVTTTVSSGGSGGYAPQVTDGFIRMPSGSIPTDGFLTVQFTTTPNCTSGVYTVTTSPATNAANPPSGTNQSVSETGGSLTVAAGLADLSITKTDSPDPVAMGSTLTYTLGVHNAGPDDASAVKVVDTLPAGVTFVSATGTNWTCNNVSGTVTCNRTGGNLAAGTDAPNITVAVTPTGARRTITNSAVVSSPNDNTTGNNTATASTLADNPPTATVSLNDHNPSTNDTLTATATKADADGDPVTLTYVWKVNGVVKKTTSGSSSLTDTFNLSVAGNGNRGDTVTVEVTPNDGSLDGATAHDSATVINTAPTATVSLNTHSPQTNDTLTATATKADVDGDAVTLTYVWKVNGVVKKTTAGSSSLTDTFDLSQPGNGDQGDTISVEVTPSDGTASGSTVSDSATISNHAPTATVSLNDHSPKTNDTLTATATKADADGDPVTLTYVWKVNGVVKKTTSGSSSLTDTFNLSLAGNGSKGDTITVEVTPNDGSVNGSSASDSAVVANTAPTVALSGANSLSVNEGSTQTYSYSISDPDGDTIASVNTSCGANGAKVSGSDSFSNTSGSFQCTFGDGPNSSTVSAQANDGAANSNSSTQSVSILNVAPTATLANNGPVNEGSSATISFLGQSDPSGADTSAGFRYEYRCDGSAFPGPADYSSASTSASTSCSFNDNGSDIVRARIIDEDGGATSYTTTVVVQNVKPSLTVAADQSSNEGSSHSFNIGSFSDPGADSDWSVSVDWGDGSFATVFTRSSTGTIPAQSHTYADGPNDYTVSVTVTDKDGASDTKTFSAQVNNVAPSIAISGNANVNEGSAYSLTLGAVSDPGVDTVSSYIVHWGDGQSDTYSSNGSKSHTYADGPSDRAITVDLVDEDGTFSNAANALSVHVNNVAPSIVISGNSNVDEGSPYSLTLGAVSDPGADTVSSYVVHWGDGSSDTYTSNGAKSHTYADGPDDHAVTVDLVDEDGTFNDRANAFSVHVNNVAPTANVTGPASVDEGTTHTYTFTVSDPGDDTFSVNSGYPTCGTGGSYVSGSLSTGAHGGSFDCFFPDGPASTDVKIKVTDSDGASDIDSESVQVVQVANVAPDVTAPADQSSNEGSSHSFDLGSFTDPGADSPWHVTVDWNDGSFNSTFDVASPGTIPAQSHTYADGPSDHVVTVTVDDGTDHTSKTFSVHVNNVAPSIAISGNANVDEGSAYTLNLGAVTDPGADTVSSYVVHWGDGSDDTYASSGAKSHTYADGPSDHAITVDLVDEDGTYTNAANPLSVHVVNVAPSITISGNSNVDEGSGYSLNLGAVSDPGTDTVSSYIVHWGDGSSDTYSSNGAKSHTYADGPSDHAITVDLIDEDGTFTNAANPLSVHVVNVAPSITISGNSNVDEGSGYSLDLGAVTDPGTDTVSSYVVHWGDGSTDTYGSNGAKSHTYADGPSDHSITVDLVDEDSTYLDRANALSVHVNNVVPSIAVSGNASVNEGSAYSLDLGAVTDPGTDTVSSYVVHWGDGSTDTYGSNGAKSHTYADGPSDHSITVDLVDEDGTHLDRANSLSVHVDNVAPTALISGPANVDEGSTHSYTFTVTDPGDDSFSVDVGYPTCGTGGSYVSASLTTSAHGGSFDCFFPDGPAATDVKIKVTDSDGASDIDSESVQVVQVANVAPVVTAPADQSSNEGSAHSFDLGSFTDPGDDSPWHVTVAWGDGSFATEFDVNSGGTIPAQSHTYADGPNDYTVAVTVDDGTDHTSKTFSVDVNNVAPSIAISGNPSVNEGSTYSLNLGTVSDPGTDTVSSYVVHWGDGSSSTYTSNGAKSHTYADGPNDYAITVDLVDEDGTYTNAANPLSVHVNNVAPSINISGAANVNEGSAYSLNLGAVTDPGSDTVSSYVVHWGDGSDDTYSSDGVKTHTYADGPSDHSITVDLVDEDGSYASAANQLSVHVNNVAPTANVTGPANVDEGSTHSYTFTVTDPGDDTFTVNDGYPNCGTGGQYVAGSLATTAHGGSFDCTFPDGPATTSVSIKVTDSDGASDTDSESVQVVQVANVAPIVTAPAAQASDEGDSHSFDLGSFTDPGDDSPWHVTVNWGDGSTATTFDAASTGSLGSKPHAYADGPNDYTVTVAVNDGTDTDSKTFAVHVANVAPTVHLSAGNGVSVNEGSSHTYTYTISDPGQDTIASVATSCGGNGSKVPFSDTNTDTGGSFGCTFPDGDSSSTVSVQATDSDSASGNTDTQSVTVHDVAPSIAISGNPSVNEGSAYSLNLGAVSDPGTDTVSSYIVHWGDGQSDTYASNGAKSHTYADGPNDYAVTVDLVDEDGTFLNRANPLSVHVNNVAPTAHLTGDATADEGTTHHYSYTVSDPGQDTFTVDAGYPSCGSNGQLMLGTVAQTPAGGSFDCFFPNGPATTNVTIRVTDSDGASTSDSESVQVVDVANVPPAVTPPANQSSNEGENHSFNLGSFTDPGADSPWHVTVAWGDGSAATTFDAASTGSLGSKSHTYADGPNDYTVTVSVNDGTDTRSATFSVHVNNAAPTVTLIGPQSADEGSAYTYSYTVSDPGSETFSRDAQSCDGGTLSNASFSTATGAGSFDCKWDDGPASKSPSVAVSDGDGGSDSKSVAVTVNNVAPTATFGNNGPVNEGQSFTLMLTSPSDPSSADTSAGFQYAFDCGDGTGYGVYSSNASRSCPTTDSGTRAVKGRVKDKDGGEREYTATVTVNNLAPTATFANDGPVNEGTSFHLSLTSPSDPSSGDTTAGFQYAFDCGSGSGYGAYGTSNTATCPTNDNSVRSVKGKIKDKDGGVTEYTGSVTVNNVAPVVTVTSPAYGTLYAKSGTSNPTVTTTATFTDAGSADTHTCSVAWDDGTTSPGTVTESNGSGTCTASHTYTVAGVYTYHVTVSDDDGGSTTADWMIVVYDASAGFITGGGWINVQPGSYPADPSLGGRANFGFNSQYKKGAFVPTGETEFSFAIGNFNFHSDAYSWLVVSGYKAQYRGTGSVNGVSGYDFTLTAYDGDVGGGGGVDKFRIRITRSNNGNVVFDNRITNGNTDMDTADPQAIAGGSIVIHKA